MIERLAEFVAELDCRRPMIVTDKGIRSAGHLDRVLSILDAASLKAIVFDEVKENPTNACMLACKSVAESNHIDLLIGLGGGSSIDTAKGCNFLLTNGGQMNDYHGYGKAEQPFLPFVAIPTTSGTGSECQSYALVSDDETHVKMACGDAKALAKIALLDPNLTRSMPLRVAQLTGLDALAHAVETAVCLSRNPVSNMNSMESFRLIASAIESVVDGSPSDDSRASMQLGAALAGLAIENSMLGAAHATANPLTALFDVTHGHAVALMLPHVVRFNRADATINEIYEKYESLVPWNAGEERKMESWLERIIAKAGLPSLTELGVKPADVESLSNAAEQQWTGRFNPRPVSSKDFEGIYQSALGAVGAGVQ